METRLHAQEVDLPADIEQQVKGLAVWIKSACKADAPTQLLKNFVPIIILYIKGKHDDWKNKNLEDMTFDLVQIKNFILETIFGSDRNNRFVKEFEAKLRKNLQRRFESLESSEAPQNIIRKIGKKKGSKGRKAPLYVLTKDEYFTIPQVSTFKFPTRNVLQNHAKYFHEKVTKRKGKELNLDPASIDQAKVDGDVKLQMQGLNEWIINKIIKEDNASLNENLVPIIIHYLKGKFDNWETRNLNEMIFSISDIREFLLNKVLDKNLFNKLSENEPDFVKEFNKKINNNLNCRLKILNSNRMKVLTMVLHHGMPSNSCCYKLSDKSFLNLQEVKSFEFPTLEQLCDLLKGDQAKIAKKQKTQKEEENDLDQSMSDIQNTSDNYLPSIKDLKLLTDPLIYGNYSNAPHFFFKPVGEYTRNQSKQNAMEESQVASSQPSIIDFQLLARQKKI